MTGRSRTGRSFPERPGRTARRPRRGRAARRVAVLSAVLAAAPLAAPADASAQRGTRSGFWLETGTGTGAVRTACSTCEDVTVAYGAASHVRVGGALSPSVLLGLEVFSHDADLELGEGGLPVGGENATITPIVLWYVGNSGVYLKAGAGLARGQFTTASASGPAVTTTRTGSGLTFGVGFDVALVRWVALSANLGTYVTAIGDVTVEGVLLDDVIATVYEAGVALTLR